MNLKNLFHAALGSVFALVLGGTAQAASLASVVRVVSATPALAAGVPTGRDFTVSSTETLELRLTDLINPQPLTSVRAVVTRGTAIVARLDAAGTKQFAATPGSYHVQVLGTPASGSAGSFVVDVRSVAGATSVYQFSDVISGVTTADPTAGSLQQQFDVTQAGTYQLTLADRRFPAPLAELDLLLIDLNSGNVMASLSGPCDVTECTTSMTLSPSTYGLVVASNADSIQQAGLYSVSLTGPAGAVPYSATLPVGAKAAVPSAATLSAAGAYVLTLRDFATPVALTSLRAMVVQRGTLLGSLAAPGTVTLQGAVAGPVDAYVLGASAASGGSYSLRLAQGSQLVLDAARTLPDGYDSVAKLGGYSFSGTVASGGSHAFQIADAAFVTPFLALRSLVVQGGQVVQSFSGAASSTVTLSAGPVTVLVFGTLQSSSANSLFAVSLKPQGGGTAAIEQAQGVGGQFQTQNVTISSAGSYDLSFADLGFPAGFPDAALALMQGTQLVTQIFGGGKTTFSATPGTYSVNVLTRLSAAASYGAWAYELADTPAAPTITFSASPTSVTSKSTSTLQWSTTGASSCLASGGWSGSKSLSGSESTAAITADTTYTLSCTGLGGTTIKSVTVTLTASTGGSSGGGGSTDLLCLAALGGLAILRRRRLADYNASHAENCRD